MNIKGKTAVVTGATGGLGREFVKLLDKEGVKCILLSRSQDKLNALVSTLTNKDHMVFTADFNDLPGTSEVLAEITTKTEKIDLLFNVMGIGVYKGIEDVTTEEWMETMNVNLNAPFLVTKQLIPLLKKSEKAYVVNIGSGLGREIYWTERVAYITSKFGLRGLSLALSKDYENTNLNFSYIALGSMLTDFGPGGLENRLKKQNEGKKYFTPDWVARKLIERIKDDKLETELVLYPSDYTHEQLKS